MATSTPHQWLVLMFTSVFVAFNRISAAATFPADFPTYSPPEPRGLLVQDAYIAINTTVFTTMKTLADDERVPVDVEQIAHVDASSVIVQGAKLVAICGQYKYHNVYDDLLPVVRLMEQHNLWNTTKPSERIIVYLNTLADRPHNPVFLELLSTQFATIILSEQHWWQWLATHLHPGNNSQSMFARFEHTLLVPTALTGSGQVDYEAMSVLARETEAALRAEGLPPVDAPQYDVVLIYREQGARSFVNLHNIVERLQQHCQLQGWACNALPASGSFREQWVLFSRARTLVAAHGASLSNILWMQPGAAVVEIFPMGFENLLYQGIAQHLQLRYFSMHASGTHHLWIHFDWLNKPCSSVECPALGDFNYLQCLVTRNTQDTTCRKVLRQQRVQVNEGALMDVLDTAHNVSYTPQCLWRMQGGTMAVECS